MKRTKKDGFTLAEVVVTLFVLGFVLIGIGQMMLDMTRTSFITAEKLDINADVREFTLEMAENARAANHFLVYRSFQAGDRDDPADRLRDGRSGDFLLLIYKQPWPSLNSPDHVTQLVGYFREADPSNPDSEGPVKRFVMRFHEPGGPGFPGSKGPYVSLSDTDVEELIGGLGYGGNYKTVVQLSRGLSDGQLFYNYKERSIIVKAEIIHGNEAKWITDTYNYTVSPRG